MLSIVNQCDDLVIVELQGVFMFTGDFQHAGVMAAKADSFLEYQLQTLTDLLVDAFKDREQLLQVLFSFLGVQDLLRFHIKTVMWNMNVIIANNSVGYEDCK